VTFNLAFFRNIQVLFDLKGKTRCIAARMEADSPQAAAPVKPAGAERPTEATAPAWLNGAAAEDYERTAGKAAQKQK
jgi:hypothetical protein